MTQMVIQDEIEFQPHSIAKSSGIFFTICLFISPDLDGHREPKMKYRESPQRFPVHFTSEHFTSGTRYVHDMFV
jgi:hypothetical protein